MSRKYGREGKACIIIVCFPGSCIFFLKNPTAVQYVSGLAAMDRYREMVRTDGPVLEDDLSMGTDEYSLGGGYEDDDY